jgi:peptidoglycan hydrolase FlgJ
MTAETYRMFTDCDASCGNLFELEIFMSLITSGAAAPSPDPTIRAAAAPTTDDARLLDAAKKLEAGFLAEMLKSAGLGATRGDFGGGAGEEHFSSFLIEAQAREMVEAGGIGLAQSLFEAMKARADG